MSSLVQTVELTPTCSIVRFAGTVLIHLLAAAILHRQPQNPQSSSTPASPSPSSSAPPLPPIQSVYIRCTSPFPQVESFVTVCVDRYNLRLEVAEGNMRDALEGYLNRRRADAGEEGEVKAVLVGTRRNDPHGGEWRRANRRAKARVGGSRVGPC